MFIGFLEVTVRFIEKSLCVSFSTQNKIQNFQKFTWFKASLLRQSSYALSFLEWLVVKPNLLVSFSSRSVMEAEGYLVIDTAVLMSILFTGIRWLKPHYLACRCLLKGMWTPDSSCHTCSVWWGTCCKNGNASYGIEQSVQNNISNAFQSWGKKTKQNCLIATLGDLQSHPEVDMSYEHYFIPWWKLSASFLSCYQKNNLLISSLSFYSLFFK